MNLLKIFTYGGIIEVFIVPHILPCVSGFIPGYVNDMIQLGISLVSSLFPHITINVQSEVFFKVWKDLENAAEEVNRTFSSLPDIQSDLDSRSKSGSLPSSGSPVRSDFAQSDGDDTAPPTSRFPKSGSCKPCQRGNLSGVERSTTSRSTSAVPPESTTTSNIFPKSSDCNPCKFESLLETKNVTTVSDGTIPKSNCCLPSRSANSSEVRNAKTASSYTFPQSRCCLPSQSASSSEIGPSTTASSAAFFPKSTSNSDAFSKSDSCKSCNFDDSSETKNTTTFSGTVPKSNSCSSCQLDTSSEMKNLETSTKPETTKTDSKTNSDESASPDMCQHSAKFLAVTRTTWETRDAQSGAYPVSKSTNHITTSLLLGCSDVFAPDWSNECLINPTNRHLLYENYGTPLPFQFEKAGIRECRLPFFKHSLLQYIWPKI